MTTGRLVAQVKNSAATCARIIWCIGGTSAGKKIKDNAMTTIESYYDQLAPFHRYIFHDWEESIARQAKILDAVIQESFSSGRRVLDAACGIGTQSLGLAQLGYDV